MKIRLTSVFVDDQEKALRFYMDVLGFVKSADIAAGHYRWLTVVSPEEPDGAQLLLEPNVNPAARSFQGSIFEQGIPAAMFFVDDVEKEYQRLKKPWSEIHDGADTDARLDHRRLRRYVRKPDTVNSDGLAFSR